MLNKFDEASGEKYKHVTDRALINKSPSVTCVRTMSLGDHSATRKLWIVCILQSKKNIMTNTLKTWFKKILDEVQSVFRWMQGRFQSMAVQAKLVALYEVFRLFNISFSTTNRLSKKKCWTMGLFWQIYSVNSFLFLMLRILRPITNTL